MTKNDLSIAFEVVGLTHLRYLIPFSYRVNLVAPDVKQTFVLMNDSTKYNGLAYDKNKDKCEKILKTFCSYANIIDDSLSSFDISVIIETDKSKNVIAKKKISLQHGFDCAYRLQNLSNEADVIICGSQLMADFISDTGANYVVAPFPVCLWSLDHYDLSDLGSINKITVFYPDSCDSDIANDIIKCLLQENFNVFVKQRRKHQAITSEGKHVYDDVWYPSEAILHPLTSRAVIAFGSTAYTDLISGKCNYYNFDFNYDKNPWNMFSHPVAENYHRFCSKEEIISNNVLLHILNNKHTPVVDNSELINEFVLNLIQCMRSSL